MNFRVTRRWAPSTGTWTHDELRRAMGAVGGGSQGVAGGTQGGGGLAAAARRDRRTVAAGDVLAARERVCRACKWLDDLHCTHPGCPHCFRHPTLQRPWMTVRKCPAGLW